ncbi:MAG: hypothetical protein AAF825_09880 [Pseudomonadota bacterium]
MHATLRPLGAALAAFALTLAATPPRADETKPAISEACVDLIAAEPGCETVTLTDPGEGGAILRIFAGDEMIFELPEAASMDRVPGDPLAMGVPELTPRVEPSLDETGFRIRSAWESRLRYPWQQSRVVIWQDGGPVVAAASYAVRDRARGSWVSCDVNYAAGQASWTRVRTDPEAPDGPLDVVEDAVALPPQDLRPLAQFGPGVIPEPCADAVAEVTVPR